MASMIQPQTDEQRARSERLRVLVAEANARFEALSPEEQREHRAAQQKSWVIGEFMLQNPDVTREYAEYIYENIKQ